VSETHESDAAAPAATLPPRTREERFRARIDSYERLVRLDKPIGTLLLLWPTLSALWLATFGKPPLHYVVIFAVGTLLMRSAGCAFNDWADRHFDAHVERTAKRPLAAGEIRPWEALAVAAALAFCAFLLVLGTNRAAILMSLPAIGIAIVYPFTKRFFALPQAFLGLAFSFGIPMAYAGVYGDVPRLGWWLLWLNAFWVMAYDTEYAMVDREDDRRLGLRTSAIFFGRFDVAAVMLCYAVYLAGMAAIGHYWRAGPIYYAGLGAAALCTLWHFWLIRTRERDRCFRAFLHNHWLGLAVFAGIAVDFAVRARAWPQTL
jgi:4-hydroxybenzoate polyprenyltransferase